MPKVSDKSKNFYKHGMGMPEDPIRTVISVSPPPVLAQGDHNVVTVPFSSGVETDPDHQANKNLVARTLSNRSTYVSRGTSIQGGGGKKLGHRRVGDDGEVTYKRFETTQLIGSIQLGLEYVLTNDANVPDRDLLLPDFMSIETVPFTKDGLLEKTPAHNYSEFRFRIYAAHAFRVFRRLFEIDTEFFLYSLSMPMVELSAAGASGSIFYVTRDDNFICKTVQHKEAEFLQKLLPGYYMNLKQNPRTLLPKFFGLYCYSCNAKNVRILVMNNLLPSGLKMHHKFDLKGSTYKRKASKRERAKNSPTFKDLDFMEMYPDGIFLQPELYQSLTNSIQRDCRVLESFKIMDYSLLIGIHNVDQANKEREANDGDNVTVTAAAASDGESSSTGTAGALPYPNLERQGSIQGRERMIAHSTALESITVEVDSMSIGGGNVGHGATSVNTNVSNLPIEEDLADEATDSGINNVWGGIPAKNKKGENLLLFIGIIDILQSYRMLKKMEHFWKSLIHDGDTVSVHRPGFYAKRFQTFLFDRVFKKLTVVPENKRGTSFRRGNLRRTLSRDQDQIPSPSSVQNSPVPAPSISEKKDPSAATVTVIRIGDGPNEVNLPYVLQDRGRAPSSGNWVLTRQSSTISPPSENNVITVNAEVADKPESSGPPPDVLAIKPPVIATPEMRNVERPFAKGEADDKHETGSVITMTSDERVQIFVPSPQGTPYNTITKGVPGTTMCIGSANLAPLFVPQRMPNSESYRSLTPLNMSANSPAHEIAINTTNTTETTNVVLQETSLEMIKISLVSSTSTSSTDRTIANDIESLPVDQPVSLSQIQLEEVAEEDA